MAKAIPWHGSNKTLRAGNGDDRIGTLPVFNNGHCTVSCWQLTDEELVDIVQPPVFVGTEDSVRRIAIDFGGVWKKGKGVMSIVIGLVASTLAIIIFACSCVPSQDHTQGVLLLIVSALFLIAAAIAFH